MYKNNIYCKLIYIVYQTTYLKNLIYYICIMWRSCVLWIIYKANNFEVLEYSLLPPLAHHIPDEYFLVKSAEKSWLLLFCWLQSIGLILNSKYLKNFIIKVFDKWECIFIEKVKADKRVPWHSQYLIRTLYSQL